MPTLIRLGADGAIAQASGLDFGPSHWTWRVREQGTWAAMVSRAATYQAAGFQGTVDPVNGSSPLATLSAHRVGSDPDDPDSDLLTTWTLDVQWDNVPAMQSLKYRTWLAAEASSDEIEMANLNRLMLSQYDQITANYAAWNSTARGWFRTIQQNRPIKEPHPVLRRVSVHSYASSAEADWTDVGKIWTTAQIEAAETVDEHIGTLPSGKLWLKTSGSIDEGSDGRLSVVTHWVEGDYQSHEYDFKA